MERAQGKWCFCFYNDDAPGFSLWKNCSVIREMDFFSPERDRNLSCEILWESRIWKATEVNCLGTERDTTHPLLWSTDASVCETAGIRTEFDQTVTVRISRRIWKPEPIWAVFFFFFPGQNLSMFSVSAWSTEWIIEIICDMWLCVNAIKVGGSTMDSSVFFCWDLQLKEPI